MSMNKLIFDGVSYDIAVNGLRVSDSSLVAKIVSDDFDGVEATVAPVEEIIQTLEDGTKVAAYRGYTKLISIEKMFDYVVDYEIVTREEVRPKIDPETGKYIIDPATGEPETEIVEVSVSEPVLANILIVTLFQPTLEETVTEQGEEITELQEAIAEMG